MRTVAAAAAVTALTAAVFRRGNAGRRAAREV